MISSASKLWYNWYVFDKKQWTKLLLSQHSDSPLPRTSTSVDNSFDTLLPMLVSQSPRRVLHRVTSDLRAVSYLNLNTLVKNNLWGIMPPTSPSVSLLRGSTDSNTFTRESVPSPHNDNEVFLRQQLHTSSQSGQHQIQWAQISSNHRKQDSMPFQLCRGTKSIAHCRIVEERMLKRNSNPQRSYGNSSRAA